MAITAALLDRFFPVDDAGLTRLRDQVRLVQLPAGQSVFHPGDVCNNYLVVVDGCVRVQVLSAGGREVVLYRVGSGESCVITTSCLISHEAYPAEGIADRQTTALVIPQQVFDEALGLSADFRRFVFSSQGQRLGELIQRIEDVAFGRVDTRLARLLVDRSHNGTLPVAATHQQLASELGTAREVISRQLKVFERKGWIAVRRGSVEVLQLPALQQMGDVEAGG